MVTTNQKTVTDIQTIKRKEYTCNIKDSHQITGEKMKEEKTEQIHRHRE